MDARSRRDRSRLTGGTFWLGTDDQGRDMLSAIFYGLRISLAVGAASTVLALVHRPDDGADSRRTSAGASRR